jgi:hypothetical protein
MRDGITPAEIRKQNRPRFDSGQRNWSFTRGAKLAEFDTIVWTRTIAGVRLEDPQVYCADVELWAASVLADAETLLSEIGSSSPAT